MFKSKSLESLRYITSEIVNIEGEDYEFRDSSVKNLIAYPCSLGSSRFVKKLYDLNSEIFIEFTKKQLALEKSSMFLKTHFAIVDENAHLILSVSQDETCINHYGDCLNKLYKIAEEEYSTEICCEEKFTDSCITTFVYPEFTDCGIEYGIVFRYYLNSNYLCANNYLKEEGHVYINPISIIEQTLEDESIEILISPDVLKIYLDPSESGYNIIKISYKSFRNQDKIRLSVQELYMISKNTFGFKIKESSEIEDTPRDSLLSGKIYPKWLKMFSEIMNQLYLILSKNYLKSSISLTSVTVFDVYEMISIAFVENDISIEDLIHFLYDVTTNKLNYFQIQ
jgi:hypothetical protein